MTSAGNKPPKASLRRKAGAMTNSSSSRQRKFPVKSDNPITQDGQDQKRWRFEWTVGRNQRFEGPAELFWPVFTYHVLRITAESVRAILLALIAYLVASL